LFIIIDIIIELTWASSCQNPATTYQNIAEERGKEPFKDFEVIFNRALSVWDFL
jgi:hypothetical protein